MILITDLNKITTKIGYFVYLTVIKYLFLEDDVMAPTLLQLPANTEEQCLFLLIYEIELVIVLCFFLLLWA